MGLDYLNSGAVACLGSLQQYVHVLLIKKHLIAGPEQLTIQSDPPRVLLNSQVDPGALPSLFTLGVWSEGWLLCKNGHRVGSAAGSPLRG